MCACNAGPVSLAKVSFHFSLWPFSVPLKRPWAARSFTTCFGTSWPELSAAVQTVVLTDAPDSAARASAQAAPAASNETNFLILLLLMSLKSRTDCPYANRREPVFARPVGHID